MNAETFDPDAVPLSHIDARRRIAAGLEPQLAQLRRFDLFKRLAELAFFPLLWTAGANVTLLSHQAPLRLLGIAISAMALNGFVLLLHEGMHAVLFPRPIINRCVSVLLGGCVLMSFTAYQVLHVRHHQHLGDENDPDDYHNYSTRPWVVWTLHYVRLLAGSFLYILLIPLLATRYANARQRRHIAQEYAFLLIVWTTLAWLVPFHTLALVWLIPLVIVGYMTNIRGFTQHGMTDAHDPLLASRSMHPNRVVSLLLLNENLHLEHHLFPEIPSYNLPRLQRLIEPRLPRAVVGRSYLAFLGRFFRATFVGDETPIGVARRTKEGHA
jgi:fatty acid desaturase